VKLTTMVRQSYRFLKELQTLFQADNLIISIITGLSKAHIIALKYLLVCLGARKVSLNLQIIKVTPKRN
jgi:hypothetical protein